MKDGREAAAPANGADMVEDVERVEARVDAEDVAELGRDGAEGQDHGERKAHEVETEEPGEEELAGAERAIAAVLERDVGQGGAGGDQREDRDRRIDRGEAAQAAPAASSAAP